MGRGRMSSPDAAAGALAQSDDDSLMSPPQGAGTSADDAAKEPQAAPGAITSTYSGFVAVIFVLNVTMGTGPIALPYSIDKSGVFLSGICLFGFAFLAYFTLTFLIEVMVIANVMLKFRGDFGEVPVFELQYKGNRKQYRAVNSSTWTLGRRVEYVELAEMFFGPLGAKLCYLILILMTMGTLAVFAVAVPLDLQSLFPPKVFGIDPYYIILTAFTIVTLPFCFKDMQNTKYLQLVVMFFRFLCVICMIYGAINIAVDGHGTPPKKVVKDGFQTSGLAYLFGNAVCTYMMHHSAPGLVSPIAPQSRYKSSMFTAFMVCLVLYLGLSVSALFAFEGHIQPIYNLNFVHFKYKELAIFLQVFPIALVASAPVIAITLRNTLLNLARLLTTSTSKYKDLGPNKPTRSHRLPSIASNMNQRLLTDMDKALEVDVEAENLETARHRAHHSRGRQILFTFLAFLPPVGLAYVTSDVQIVRTLAGAFPGIGVMIIMPCLLVLRARKLLLARVAESVNSTQGILSPRFRHEVDENAVVLNPQASPLKSKWFVYFILFLGLAGAVYEGVVLTMRATGVSF